MDAKAPEGAETVAHAQQQQHDASSNGVVSAAAQAHDRGAEATAPKAEAADAPKAGVDEARPAGSANGANGTAATSAGSNGASEAAADRNAEGREDEAEVSGILQPKADAGPTEAAEAGAAQNGAAPAEAPADDSTAGTSSDATGTASSAVGTSAGSAGDASAGGSSGGTNGVPAAVAGSSAAAEASGAPGSSASNASSGPPTPTLSHATPAGAPRKFASASVTKKFLEKAAPAQPAAAAPTSGTLTLSLGSGSKLSSTTAKGKLAPSTKSAAPTGWASVSSPGSTPGLSTSTGSKLSLGTGRSSSPAGASATLGTNVRSASPAGPAAAAAKAVPWTKGAASGGANGMSSREADRLKTAFPTAAEAARAQKEAEERAAAAAAEAQARQEEALKALESFRGSNLRSGNNWDELDDDEFFGDVVDFGDGKQYKISAQPTASAQPGEAAEHHRLEERREEQSRYQEVEANFEQGPVSKEERFKDVGHDRTLTRAAAPAAASRPPPWGGIKRDVGAGSADGASEGAASAGAQPQKQLFDAKAPAGAGKKERRISVGAPSISLLQREREPAETFSAGRDRGDYASLHAQSSSHAPSAGAAAPSARPAWGPLAQRQASLNKVEGAPTKTVTAAPAKPAPAAAPAAAAAKPAPAPAAPKAAPAPATEPKAAPRAAASPVAAPAQAAPSGAPRPPPWGGIKRSLEGQAPAQAQPEAAPAAPAAAPEPAAPATPAEPTPEQQAQEMHSAIERARKRREEEEQRRAEEKERARAKAAALEAKLKEQEEAKARAREEAKARKAEAAAAVAAAKAERAEKARAEAAAAAAAAHPPAPSDAASTWRRTAPSADVSIAKRAAPAPSPSAEPPRKVLLQRPAAPQAQGSAPANADAEAKQKPQATAAKPRSEPQQQPRPEPQPQQQLAASTRSEMHEGSKRKQQPKARIPKVEGQAPIEDSVPATRATQAPKQPKPQAPQRYVPPEPLLTRAEVAQDGPPAWKHFAVKLTQGLKRALLQEAESRRQLTVVSRANSVRSQPIYALTWDPPLATISIRTLSRDEHFFPKRSTRGTVQSHVSMPARRLPRGLKQINDPSGRQVSRVPSPVGFASELDTSIATAPIEQPGDSGPQRVKVSLPKAGAKAARNAPQIRLPRAGAFSSAPPAHGVSAAPSSTLNARSSPFQAALNAATSQNGLSETSRPADFGSSLARGDVLTHSSDFASTALGTSPPSVTTRTREDDSPISFIAQPDLADIAYPSENAALIGNLAPLPDSSAAAGQSSTLPHPKSTASPWGFPMLEGAHSAPDSDEVKKVWAQPSSSASSAQNSLKAISNAFLPSSLVQDLRNEEAPPLSAGSVDSHRVSEAPLDDLGGADSVFNPHAITPELGPAVKEPSVRSSPAVRQNGFPTASPSMSSSSVMPSSAAGSQAAMKASMQAAAAGRYGAGAGLTGYESASFGPTDYQEAYAGYGYFPYNMTAQQLNAYALQQQRQYNAAAMQFGSSLAGASPYAAMSPMGMGAYNAFRPPATSSVPKGFYGAGMSNAAFPAGATSLGWGSDVQASLGGAGAGSTYPSQAGRGGYRPLRGGGSGRQGSGYAPRNSSQQIAAGAFGGAPGAYAAATGMDESTRAAQQVHQVQSFGAGYYGDSVW